MWCEEKWPVGSKKHISGAEGGEGRGGDTAAVVIWNSLGLFPPPPPSFKYLQKKFRTQFK